jgi:GT2 family glycosyltransferase/SAM-dependent methyltransferase|tara:strand:- start:521 stop:4654 length:4134 start_codon:yes stop_codon:yes gene_type:complete
LKHFYLGSLNRLSRGENNVWVDSSCSTKFEYSDGDESERYLKEVLQSAEDLSSQSTELEELAIDWPSEYHLSTYRANLLRPLALNGVERVLEIGCGCGAITRYLGDRGFEVEAVEGSPIRAELARLRCRELQNVEITASNLFDLTLPEKCYDAVLFIGVLEYAQQFSPSAKSAEEAVADLLTLARSALKEDGIIIVAIENRLGLKYLLGAGEDHYGIPYEGIYNYPHFSGIKTFSKREWESIIEKSGMVDRFLYPFPDYKLPTLVLSDHFLNQSPSASVHLSGLMGKDYHKNSPVDERHSFWAALGQNDHIDHYSNSFLIVIGNSIERIEQELQSDFLHVSSLVRKPKFRTLTEKMTGKSEVVKHSLYSNSNQPESGDVRQNLGKERYIEGTLLAEQWKKLLEIKPREELFFELATEYYHFIEGQVLAAGSTASLIDLTPMNIIVTPSGKWTSFDQEWETKQTPPIETIFVRGLFFFILNNRTLFRERFDDIYDVSIKIIISRVLNSLGILSSLILVKFVEFEENFQKEIMAEGNDPKKISLHMMGFHHRTFFDQATLYWSPLAGAFSAEFSIVDRIQLGESRQQITFLLPNKTSLPLKLRFDPSTHPGFFHLFSIKVFKYDKEREELIQSFKNGVEIASETTLNSIVYNRSNESDVFVAQDRDPNVEWFCRSDSEWTESGRLKVVIEMDWVQGDDFRLAQDAFLRKDHINNVELELLTEELEDTRRRLEQTLKESVEEISIMKNSTVWRTAEFLKRLSQQTGIWWLSSRLKYFLSRTTKVGGSEGMDGLSQESGGDGEDPRHKYRNRHISPVRTHLYSQAVTTSKEVENKIASFGTRPLISILMPVYNARPEWLEDAFQTLLAQSYTNWELCLVDDGSTDQNTLSYIATLWHPQVKTKTLSVNKGISGATNEALQMADGDFVGLMDNDDLLAPDALLEVVEAINNHNPEIIYSDEDLLTTEGRFAYPHFKPDFSPDLLLSHNYITHFLVINRNLLLESGGFRPEFDGAQDYDLLLRLTDNSRRKVHHIPKVLYHWRESESSTSKNSDAKPEALLNAKRSLEETLKRRGINGSVDYSNRTHFFRVKRKILEEARVSIVIPFKDKPELLKGVIDSILLKSTYQLYEIVGVSNNSISDDTFNLMRSYSDSYDNISFHEYNIPFNFPNVVNYGIDRSQGEQIVLLNNDIEIISWGWIEALLEHSQRAEVGVVGGKLIYPNNTIQHAGIIVGIGGYAGHAHRFWPVSGTGYNNRLCLAQNYSAVTGAFMMFKRPLFDQLGGFEGEHFPIACNDIDFCLRAREEGYLNVYTPYAEAYHLESASRGYEESEEQMIRFGREKAIFQKRHQQILEQGDPFYNPNLSLLSERFELGPEAAAFYENA